MTSWTAADLPSFAGRTVIVTGANSGLGEVTARELARVGAQVILAVRNTGKGEPPPRRDDRRRRGAPARPAGPGVGAAVRRRRRQRSTSWSTTPASWPSRTPSTADGFESQIGTNHLGHFALTNLLLPKVTDRVVTVSSMMHCMGYISLEDLNWKSRPYSAWLAYGQSKLANLLFTSELQRRLDAAGSTLRARGRPPRLLARPTCRAHSGRKLGDALMSVGNRLATDADFGARQTLYAASQDLPGNSFIGPRFGDARPHQAGRAQPAGPNATQRPARCGSCPSSSRTAFTLDFRSEPLMR